MEAVKPSRIRNIGSGNEDDLLSIESYTKHGSRMSEEFDQVADLGQDEDLLNDDDMFKDLDMPVRLSESD